MQKVVKSIFLIDDKLENNLKFWVLLGPFLLFLSISLASFEFALVSAISLFICYRFKFKGLFLALLSVVIYSFYTQVNLETNHLWNLGLEMSVALGLIISACGFDEIKNYISSHEKNKDANLSDLTKKLEDKQKNFEAFQSNLQKNINILKAELQNKTQNISLITKENDKLKKEIQDHICRKDYLLNELDQKVKEIEELQVTKDGLYDKLAFLKDEEHLQEKNKDFQKEIDELQNMLSLQKEEKKRLMEDFNKKVEIIKELENRTTNSDELAELNEKLMQKEAEIKSFKELENKEDHSKELAQLCEKLKEKEAEIKTLKEKRKEHSNKKSKNVQDKDLLKEYENKLKELNRFNSLYSQLKEQFEEKQLVLHKTRQDLFQVNEQLTALQRDQNDDYKDFNEYEKAIINDLDKTEHELRVYKEENHNLENIVDLLLSKKSNISKKEDKKTSSEQELLF